METISANMLFFILAAFAATQLVIIVIANKTSSMLEEYFHDELTRDSPEPVTRLHFDLTLGALHDRLDHTAMTINRLYHKLDSVVERLNDQGIDALKESLTEDLDVYVPITSEDEADLAVAFAEESDTPEADIPDIEELMIPPVQEESAETKPKLSLKL